MCLPLLSSSRTTICPESSPAINATGGPNSSSGRISVTYHHSSLGTYSTPIDELSGLVEHMPLTSSTRPLSEREVTVLSPDGSLPSDGSASLSTETAASAFSSSVASTDSPKENHGGSSSSSVSASRGEALAKEAAGAAGAKSVPEPLMLSIALLLTKEDRFSLLQSLNDRVKSGLLSFRDYEAVQTHAIELLSGKCRSREEVQFLFHSARQFAEFQTLQQGLPKTNEFENGFNKTGDRIRTYGEKIIYLVERSMNNKSLDTKSEVRVYLWTLQKIVELSIPHTHYIQVYRYVTNYVRIRTNGSDWLPEETIVMQALSHAISSRTINIREIDDRIVSDQTTAWTYEIMRAKNIPAALHGQISERVHSYVMEVKTKYQARKAQSLTLSAKKT